MNIAAGAKKLVAWRKDSDPINTAKKLTAWNKDSDPINRKRKAPGARDCAVYRQKYGRRCHTGYDTGMIPV